MESTLKLFRYRSNSKYSVDSFLRGKMFFICPLELNDSFEFYIKYDVDKVYELIKKDKKAKSIVARKLYKYSIDFGDIGGYKSKPKTTKECLSLFDSKGRIKQTKQWLVRAIEKKIIQFKESFGIVSLTENPKEPVMWSHYASDSSGFLEIYDAELLLFNFGSYLRHISLEGYTNEQMSVLEPREIKYIKEFPERNELVVKLLCTPDDTNTNIGIDFITNKDIAEEVVAVIYSKLSAWEYEKEIRLVLPCDIYNLKRKKKNDGQIIHEHYFENTFSTPEAIVLGYKADLELEYSARFYCSNNRIKFKKSDDLFNFNVD